MRHRAPSLAAIAAIAGIVGASLIACDPCAGTPSCKQPPEVSYGGQFINHVTGSAVGGVAVMFVRATGPTLANGDTIRDVARSDGFFQLRSSAFNGGVVEGKLIVTPPPPYQSYTVSGLKLPTSEVRGNGTFAGRLVVDPYLPIVGEVHDRKTGAIVPGVAVSLRQVGGVSASPESMSFVTAGDGRFFGEPTVNQVGPLDYEVVLQASGYPRPYRFGLHLRSRYVDGPAYDVTVLVLGSAIQYVGEALRRGTRENYPGVQVEFRRTGGIPVTPEIVTPALTPEGLFGIYPEPLADGDLIGDLTIRPPAPLPVEIIRGLRLSSSDGDSLRLLGHFGYGAQVFFRVPLVNRATGLPVEEGLVAFVRRTGGVALVLAAGSNANPDSALYSTDSLGRLAYAAATADSGDVTFDVEVKVPGAAAENLRGLRAQARYDSIASTLATARVGLWFPWYGELRDATTDAPIGDVLVEFQRLTGGEVTPATFLTRSSADGTFRLAPVPLTRSASTGTLRFQFGGGYRDTVISVQLQPTQDDTLQLLSVYRFTRIAP